MKGGGAIGILSSNAEPWTLPKIGIPESKLNKMGDVNGHGPDTFCVVSTNQENTEYILLEEKHKLLNITKSFDIDKYYTLSLNSNLNGLD